MDVRLAKATRVLHTDLNYSIKLKKLSMCNSIKLKKLCVIYTDFNCNCAQPVFINPPTQFPHFWDPGRCYQVLED